MPVNIYEKAIQPVVDLDSDVIVYVPGYANIGPGEPTLVNSDNFTAIFGSSPYMFVGDQTDNASSLNNITGGFPEKSWLLAKGLVDAGLNVLYHRCNPNNVGTADVAASAGLSLVVASRTAPDPDSTRAYTKNTPLCAEAKYFGGYYAGMTVRFNYASSNANGSTIVSVYDKSGTRLEERSISFNPAASNYIEYVTFTYIRFYWLRDTAKVYEFNDFGFASWYADPANASNAIYFPKTTVTGTTLDTGTYLELVLSTPAGTDEFTVSAFLTQLAGTDSPIEVLKDTDVYESVTYITSGGYFQSAAVASKMAEVADDIKSMALVALPDSIDSTTALGTLQSTLATNFALHGAKATMLVGADTYVIDGYRLVIPDYFGYLQRLGVNVTKSIPPWVPVANNPQGVVSAIAATRPVTYAVKSLMISSDGVSINPIVYKQNVGYTIMGNRTLFINDGVLGPESFLNCQLVVNTVARAARRAATRLLIVSTNAQTAFSDWKSSVSKTCEKMLVNGDGLAAYSILKLKKTKPATIDTLISLTVREGLETFNINLQYQLDMQG